MQQHMPTSLKAWRSLRRSPCSCRTRGARAPSEADCVRLREVNRQYRATKVVSFQWRKAESAEFSVLGRNLQWVPATSKEIFG
jgi:hypothetical protein